jgi:hypothetical protein
MSIGCRASFRCVQLREESLQGHRVITPSEPDAEPQKDTRLS